MYQKILKTLVIIAFFFACDHHKLDIRNLDDIPKKTEADKRFFNVFSALDGKWQGKFMVYENRSGQLDKPVQPNRVSYIDSMIASLQPIQAIEVTQIYKSKSPYFQQVQIFDKFTNHSGEDLIVESRGVNKVQEGVLYCIVKKPDEIVVHQGENVGKNTIIWHREEKKPQKIEWFYESVQDSTYSIRGWGYYSDDDPQKAPRLYFRGDYRRIE